MKKAFNILFFLSLFLSFSLPVYAGDSPCMVWGEEKFPGECVQMLTRSAVISVVIGFCVVLFISVITGLVLLKLGIKRTIAIAGSGLFLVIGSCIYLHSLPPATLVYVPWLNQFHKLLFGF